MVLIFAGVVLTVSKYDFNKGHYLQSSTKPPVFKVRGFRTGMCENRFMVHDD